MDNFSSALFKKRWDFGYGKGGQVWRQEGKYGGKDNMVGGSVDKIKRINLTNFPSKVGHHLVNPGVPLHGSVPRVPTDAWERL